MFSKAAVKKLLDELLEEEVLLIGGMVVLDKAKEDLIWELIKGMDQIRDRFMAVIENMPETTTAAGKHLNLTPHPAVEQFLLKLKRARQSAAKSD